jgi:hypothetical protein
MATRKKSPRMVKASRAQKTLGSTRKKAAPAGKTVTTASSRTRTTRTKFRMRHAGLGACGVAVMVAYERAAALKYARAYWTLAATDHYVGSSTSVN